LTKKEKTEEEKAGEINSIAFRVVSIPALLKEVSLYQISPFLQ
jgi:hypothetical protein